MQVGVCSWQPAHGGLEKPLPLHTISTVDALSPLARSSFPSLPRGTPAAILDFLPTRPGVRLLRNLLCLNAVTNTAAPSQYRRAGFCATLHEENKVAPVSLVSLSRADPTRAVSDFQGPEGGLKIAHHGNRQWPLVPHGKRAEGWGLDLFQSIRIATRFRNLGFLVPGSIKNCIVSDRVVDSCGGDATALAAEPRKRAGHAGDRLVFQKPNMHASCGRGSEE